MRAAPVQTGSSPRPHHGPAISRRVVEGVAFALACGLTVWSAAIVKGGSKGPALMALDEAHVVKAAAADPTDDSLIEMRDGTDDAAPPQTYGLESTEPQNPSLTLRWFNGRPVRPDHVMWMTVTAYTPGAESCWPSDDGQTATLHSVRTNAGCLVAADTSVLPFGSLLSIEGYDEGNVVPVLDRGGKIQGRRLDVLMETVEDARAWGVRRIPVLLWAYADGLEPTDPRQAR